MQENINIKRKRAGELNMEGSILDPRKKLIGSHCIIYSISISFLAFLIVSVFLNLGFNSQYTSLKNNLLNTYNEQIIFEQYLLTIKVYLLEGGLTIQQVLNVTN
jgi:prepilin signal peptidase PulO-like enzyme (type II secretory pathway)